MDTRTCSLALVSASQRATALPLKFPVAPGAAPDALSAVASVFSAAALLASPAAAFLAMSASISDWMAPVVFPAVSNVGAAERLREAGYRRALRDHTWERRFEELFRRIGVWGAPHRA